MIEINLLRWQMKQKRHIKQYWKIAIVLMVLLLMGLIIYFYLPSVSHGRQSVPVIEAPAPRLQKNNPDAIAATIPLEQLQLSGYLEFDHLLTGFLKLPNGQIREIKPGSIIGKESARVISLNKQKMVLEINGSQVIKKYLV